MPVRATTTDVITRAAAALDAEARAAAGNHLLSLPEQATLPPGLLADAAHTVRARGANRVQTDALVQQAALHLDSLLASVNNRGPSMVSQAEVRALHSVNADAGVRVARAYELITGKHIALPTDPAAPVVTPGGRTPARGSPVPISAFTQTPNPQMPYAGPTTLHADGTLSVVRGALIPSTFTVDVRGQTYSATVTMSTGGNSGIATPADVVEAVRKAVAPAYDVRVNQHATAGTVIELFALEAPAPAAGPVYVFAQVKGGEHRGALRFVLNQNEVYQPGESVSVRIDNKVYTATATQRDTSAKVLVRNLRDQAVTDGRTIDLREYTNYAPWTFIVTG